MSKLVYTGTFKEEVSMFEGFDKVIMGYLKTVAEEIGKLDSSWRDDESKNVLDKLNMKLQETNESLETCHAEIARYFQDIQNVLNFYGTGSSIPLPNLEKIDLSKISESAGDGSITFDSDAVKDIMSTIEITASNITSDCDDFKPTATSINGSSDDIISAVQGNLDKAANSYQLLVSPISSIKMTINEVKTKIDERINTIVSAQ